MILKYDVEKMLKYLGKYKISDKKKLIWDDEKKTTWQGILMLKYDVENMLKYLGKHKMSDKKKGKKRKKKPKQKKTSVDLKWTTKAIHKNSWQMIKKSYLEGKEKN